MRNKDYPRLLNCPFCGGEAVIRVNMGNEYIFPIHKRGCVIKPDTWLQSSLPIKKQIKAWNTRTPKERGAE